MRCAGAEESFGESAASEKFSAMGGNDRRSGSAVSFHLFGIAHCDAGEEDGAHGETFLTEVIMYRYV
jgi:hypothetical protein